MQFRTTTEIGIKTQTLCDLLKTAAIGETISFADMSRALGQDVTKLRYVLEQARTRVLLENGMRFDSVYRVGLKRMNIDDVKGVADRTIRKIRRTARLEDKRIVQQMAKTNDISNEELFAINARRSLLGTISELSSKKSTAKIEAVADERVLPFGRVIELLK